MSKSKSKSKSKATQPAAPDAYEELTALVDIYERARYGTVAPDDRRKPAADAAATLRGTYEDGERVIDWGAVMLSVMVAARRDGMAVPALLVAVAETAAEWSERGNEPHEKAPHVIPGTYTAGVSE